MGTVVFHWQDADWPLLVLHNRDDWHKRGEWDFKAAAWWDKDEETKDIFGGRDEKTGGTWFGCSKHGRVAFLTNVLSFCDEETASLLPVRFLKGKMTPREFAEELERDKTLSRGRTFNLVVADIHSKSMVYIYKESTYKEIDMINYDVGPVYHTISEYGLDNDGCFKSTQLKERFRKLVTRYDNKEPLSLATVTDVLMHKDEVMFDGEEDSFDYSVFVGPCRSGNTEPPPLQIQEGNTITVYLKSQPDRKGEREFYGTLGTTGMIVNHTGEVSFYERHLSEHRGWNTKSFTFSIEQPRNS